MRWTQRFLATAAAFGMLSISAFAQDPAAVGLAETEDIPVPGERRQDQAGLSFQNQMENRNYPRLAPADYTPYGYPGRTTSVYRPSRYSVERPGVLWSGPRGRSVYRPTFTFPYTHGTYLPISPDERTDILHSR